MSNEEIHRLVYVISNAENDLKEANELLEETDKAISSNDFDALLVNHRVHNINGGYHGQWSLLKKLKD